MTLYYMLCRQLIHRVLLTQLQLTVQLLRLPLLHEAPAIRQECEGQSDVVVGGGVWFIEFGPRG
jgi:hypothetical protein